MKQKYEIGRMGVSSAFIQKYYSLCLAFSKIQQNFTPKHKQKFHLAQQWLSRYWASLLAGL
jgi:hypothetical protein